MLENVLISMFVGLFINVMFYINMLNKTLVNIMCYSWGKIELEYNINSISL